MKFIDDDGDVSHVIVDVFDINNSLVKHALQIIEELSGVTSGTIQFDVVIGALSAGDYTFEFYVMDRSSNESNTLLEEVNIT